MQRIFSPMPLDLRTILGVLEFIFLQPLYSLAVASTVQVRPVFCILLHKGPKMLSVGLTAAEIWDADPNGNNASEEASNTIGNSAPVRVTLLYSWVFVLLLCD